jgi:hypothetical protein
MLVGLGPRCWLPPSCLQLPACRVPPASTAVPSNSTATQPLPPPGVPLLLCCSLGVAWSFSTCNFDDFSGYADAAEQVLRGRNINVASYKYR